MHPRKFFCALILLPFLVTAARADFVSALRAYDNGDYDIALSEFHDLAVAGDADAQSILALMYLEGQAVEEDMATAINWYVQSAEQGHVGAQYALAIISVDGLGGAARDLTTAAMWMHESARRGHMYAQFDLGTMYANGTGVEESDENAAVWFDLAAQQGHKDAQYNLGIMNLTGRGVETNRETAIRWFRSAAEQGHKDAQYNLGVSYLTGRAVERDPQEANRWLQAASSQGQSSATVALGLMNLQGEEGVPQNQPEAARLFRRAADAGNPEGQYYLAVLFTRGLGVEQDPIEAYAWLEMAGARARPGSNLSGSVDTLRQSLTAVMTASEISQATAIAQQRSLAVATN